MECTEDTEEQTGRVYSSLIMLMVIKLQAVLYFCSRKNLELLNNLAETSNNKGDK